MPSSNPSILHLDTKAITVLAHPLRSRLLTLLRTQGPATATDLARQLETNTGATSYHLRKLASVGLVEETGDRRGRERPWRAATEMHGWTEHEVADDPDAKAASDWLRGYYLRSFIDRYERWLDVEASWPMEWQDVAGASDFAVRLTPARLEALNADIQALYERYRALTESEPASPDDDEQLVQVQIHAFPFEARPR
jgi:DNA-binding transcriptional ArsR family regulator